MSLRKYLSICAIFRNEADYLKEWIEFHRLVGVEHFFLYNNFSEDAYLSILGDYIGQGLRLKTGLSRYGGVNCKLINIASTIIKKNLNGLPLLMSMSSSFPLKLIN